jgi:hypothetical protein
MKVEGAIMKAPSYNVHFHAWEYMVLTLSKVMNLLMQIEDNKAGLSHLSRVSLLIIPRNYIYKISPQQSFLSVSTQSSISTSNGHIF